MGGRSPARTGPARARRAGGGGARDCRLPQTLKKKKRSSFTGGTRTPSVWKADLLLWPALAPQITRLEISCTTLCAAETVGLGHPPPPTPPRRLRSGTNPGLCQRFLPPPVLERQAPTESGRARLGKEPALCQEALDLAIFHQRLPHPHPSPSMLPAARPSSWQSGDRPGSGVPHPLPLPGCPTRCPLPFHCPRERESLSGEGAGERKSSLYQIVIFFSFSRTTFLRERELLGLSISPPLVFL